MKKDKSGITDELLRYYCDEKTTAEQEREILEWIEESKENAAYFFDLKAIYNAHTTVADREGMDSGFSAMLAKLNERINDDAQKTCSRRRNFGRIATIAASVAAVVVLAVLLWVGPFDRAVETLAYENVSDDLMFITLTDGSEVWLNKNSELTFSVGRRGGDRIVRLSGEAFFDVAKGETGEKFRVITKKYVVEVLGTAFNVKALTDDEVTEVLLESGAVRLETIEGEYLTHLLPNQNAVMVNETNEVTITDVDAAYELFLKYNLITMNDVTIDQILSFVEKTFGVKIRIADRGDLKTYNFNLLKSSTLIQVLDIIEYMTGQKCELVEE